MSPPQSQSAPRIVGDPIVGHPLSVDSGVWYSPTPVTYAYIWHRLPPNKTVGIVTVATAPTYTPVQADAGLMLAVRVVARNAAGTDNAASDQGRPGHRAARQRHPADRHRAACRGRDARGYGRDVEVTSLGSPRGVPGFSFRFPPALRHSDRTG